MDQSNDSGSLRLFEALLTWLLLFLASFLSAFLMVLLFRLISLISPLWSWHWSLLLPCLPLALLCASASTLCIFWDCGRPELERRGLSEAPAWRWSLAVKPVLACVLFSGLILLLSKCGALSLTQDGSWVLHPPAPLTGIDRVTTPILIAFSWLYPLLLHWAAWGHGLGVWLCARMTGVSTHGSTVFILLPTIYSACLMLSELLSLPQTEAVTAHPIILAVIASIFAAPFLAFFLSKAARLGRELRTANQLLADGASLYLFAKGDLESPMPIGKLISLAGPLTAEQQGRFLRYGTGRVLAGYDFFSYGLLTPSPRSDRRIVLLLDGASRHPRMDGHRLRALVQAGWLLLPIYHPESSDVLSDDLQPLLEELPGTMRITASEEQQQELLQGWLLDRQPEKRSQVTERLSRMLADLVEALSEGQGDRLCYFSCIMPSYESLVRDYDEVRCFYLMMKTAEYIIHCRALVSCRQQPEGEPVPFPGEPSFGSLEQLQARWTCGPAWTEAGQELQDAVSVLQQASGSQNKARSYAQVCSLLAYIRNRYIAHGTLVYQVTPQVAEALVTVVDHMVRDFLAQGVFPQPEDRILVGRHGVALPPCRIKGQDISLFSFLPNASTDDTGAEYLDYATGDIQLLTPRRIVLRLDYRPEDGQKAGDGA